ncbi:hypothetical protein [Naumannella cuiyingiana]|uniref:Uncharacterized protein n=1 Tax=Naumannella cuiyingiana TaxID=1347891 RepID=A0A7Z0D9A1_9ACTN|nr:hypothetical protein [Naumannella cuiyingiana]NYI71115.1 hypothetical protein [Naumannella cuiyingiana]
MSGRLINPDTRTGRLAGGVRGFVREVFVVPVRRGSPRPSGWPPGLRAIMIGTAVCYLIAIAMILVSGPMRSSTELVLAGDLMTYPRVAGPVVIMILTLCLALLLTGLLHVHPAVRIPGLFVATAIALLPAGGFMAVLGSLRLVILVPLLFLLLIILVRWRESFHWLEFVLILAIVVLVFTLPVALISIAGSALGSDVTGSVTTVVLLGLIPLAIPAAFAAGSAFVELVGSAAIWSVSELRGETGRIGAGHLARARFGSQRRRVPVLWWLIFAALVAACVASFVNRYPPAALPGVLPGNLAVLAALIALTALVVLFVRRAPGRGLDPTPLRILGSAAVLALPVGTVVTLPVLVKTVLLALGISLNGVSGTGLGDPLNALGDRISGLEMEPIRAFLALPAAVLAIWYARRGNLVSALVWVGLVGWSLLMLGAWLDLPLLEPVLLAGCVLILVLAALSWAVRRQLGPTRRFGLLAGLAFCLVLPYRDQIADPVAWLLGASGIAAVLFGLLWRVLTDADFTHVDSPGFPRAARVLLFAANALFASLALLMIAISRYSESAIDLEVFTGAGSQLVGSVAAVAVVAGLLITLAGGREVDPEAERMTDVSVINR